MSKRVLVISTSLRKGSNSDVLADEFLRGAEKVGNKVEKINLTNKELRFCIGCLACQKTGHCVLKDDANEIVNKMHNSDVIVFATPIYFYEMAGQMKTLLDRSNPLFPSDYKFRDIYLLATAAESSKSAMDGAIKGLQGWVDCFEKANLTDIVYGVGVDDAETISKSSDLLQTAYHMGQNIK